MSSRWTICSTQIPTISLEQKTPYVKYQLQSVTPLFTTQLQRSTTGTNCGQSLPDTTLLQKSVTVKYFVSQIIL